jgi:hypothetical protein
MSPRALRRAAERRARKLARKGQTSLSNNREVPLAPQIAPAAEALRPHAESAPSPAQIAANRANAQLSTGPKTPAGKARSSLNALKTGLTGRTVLLPSEDAEAYQAHLQRFFAEYQPANDKEHELVQRLADISWRLLRIPSLENALFALGRVQFEEMFADHDPDLRGALIDAHTVIAFHKQFNNLSIQESRLFRQFEKTRVELSDLQSRRRDSAPSQTAIGFEFSNGPSRSNESTPQSAIAAPAQPASQPAAAPSPLSHPNSTAEYPRIDPDYFAAPDAAPEDNAAVGSCAP